MMSTLEDGARPLTNFDIDSLVEYLDIPNYKGTFMKDQLIGKPKETECAVINLQNSNQAGSHWVAFYKDGEQRIYFDSFGQIPPTEIQKYLKTAEEYKQNIPVIQRNTDIVQKPNTNICGHLCIRVLDKLSKGAPYQKIIDSLW